MSIIEKLAGLRPSSTFLHIRGYKSSTGEIADYTLAFHMSYANALKRSMVEVETYVPESDLETQAKAEVLKSYQTSLDNMDKEESVGDAYQRIVVGGETVKGVKLHKESGKLHLFGLLVSKNVRVAGEHKAVNKKPLTVAKDKIRKLGPVNKFRQFVIDPEHFEKITVEKEVILPE